MIMEDKLVADTEDKKNELETYIYDMRNKIDDQYSEFASDDEKAKLKAKLETVEVSIRCGQLLQCTKCENRTGSMMRAKTPPRLFTSPRLMRSAAWPAPSLNATSIR